jgi:hypothetical protein
MSILFFFYFYLFFLNIFLHILTESVPGHLRGGRTYVASGPSGRHLGGWPRGVTPVAVPATPPPPMLAQGDPAPHEETVLKPDRGRTEALGAAKQRCCLVARGHSAYVRTAEPYDSKWGTVHVGTGLAGGNLGRAFEPGSGEPGVANDAGWPAGAWDDPVHEQPPKGGLSPVTGISVTPVPGPGTRRPFGPYPRTARAAGRSI